MGFQGWERELQWLRIEVWAAKSMLTSFEPVYYNLAQEIYPKGYIFQKDNASTNSALHPKDFFVSECIEVLN